MNNCYQIIRQDRPCRYACGPGGEGVLRTFGREAEAQAVIEEAMRRGITYFDSAQAYAGSEGYYGRFWKENADVRSRIFQTSKSASRTLAGAKARSCPKPSEP